MNPKLLPVIGHLGGVAGTLRDSLFSFRHGSLCVHLTRLCALCLDFSTAARCFFLKVQGTFFRESSRDFVIRVFCMVLSSEFFSSFFSFISLIADGPHHYHPACGHKGSSHLFPVHALQFFLSRRKFSTLTTRQPMVEFGQTETKKYEQQRTKNTPRCKQTSYRLNYSLNGPLHLLR